MIEPIRVEIIILGCDKYPFPSFFTFCFSLVSHPRDSYHGRPGQGFSLHHESFENWWLTKSFFLQNLRLCLKTWGRTCGYQKEKCWISGTVAQEGLKLDCNKRATWNPGVWGVYRGSVVLEGFQLDLAHCVDMLNFLVHNMNAIRKLHPLLSWISWGATFKWILKLHPAKNKSWWPPPNLRNQSHYFFAGTWPFQMSQTTDDKKKISIFFPVCHLQIHLGKKMSTKNAPKLFSCGLKTWIFSKKHTDFVIIFSVLEKQDKKQNVQRRM